MAEDCVRAFIDDIHGRCTILPHSRGLLFDASRRARSVLVVGTVVAVRFRNKGYGVTVDDGTGCIDCMEWYNDDDFVPSDEYTAAKGALFGSVVRIRGARVSEYRGQRQLTAARDAPIERVEADAENAEARHWLQAMGWDPTGMYTIGVNEHGAEVISLDVS